MLAAVPVSYSGIEAGVRAERPMRPADLDAYFHAEMHFGDL